MWDDHTRTYAQNDNVFGKLINTGNCIEEYTQLNHFLPHSWKQLLRNEIYKLPENVDKVYTLKKVFHVTNNTLQSNDEVIPFSKINWRDIYFHVLYQGQNPNSITAWKNIFQKI